MKKIILTALAFGFATVLFTACGNNSCPSGSVSQNGTCVASGTALGSNVYGSNGVYNSGYGYNSYSGGCNAGYVLRYVPGWGQYCLIQCQLPYPPYVGGQYNGSCI